MGSEQPPSWYDAAFAAPDSLYHRSPETAPWAPVWLWCAAQVAPYERVLELGCGPGHLASLLPDWGYFGIDFSPVAIEQARARCAEKHFLCARLPADMDRIAWEAWNFASPSGVSPAFSVVVACEVLEHLADDLATLARIPLGLRVVATVPVADSESHVRHFPCASDVMARYSPLLDNLGVREIGSYHLGMIGWRR